jgi:hypothetical protein
MLLEPPDADTIAMFRRMLASPYESHRETAIMQSLDIADQAASVIWERAGDKTPVERLRLALQAAAEQLEGIGAALATDESATEAKGEPRC